METAVNLGELDATSAVERVEAPAQSPRAAAGLAIGLGLMMIIGAGFAPLEAVHNAAHDTRHAFAFPCH